MRNNKTALVIGHSESIAWPLPYLLFRAGFKVEMWHKSDLFNYSAYVQDFRQTTDAKSVLDGLGQLIVQEKLNYDWVILTDDEVIELVLNSNFPENIKLKFLPVCKTSAFNYFNSKINFFELISKTNLPMPPSKIVTNAVEALRAAKWLIYPVLIKIDQSSGGAGVFECSNAHEIIKLIKLFNGQKLLVQKKIVGKELDLSALYLQGKLIHFQYAHYLQVTTKNGPSKLREYFFPQQDPVLLQELQQLGQILAVDGFVNLTCMVTPLGQRYYFEADLRPNAWVDATRFILDDLAPKIARWFKDGTCLQLHELGGNTTPVKIPLFLRMSLGEILFNRHKVWRYLPYAEIKMLMLHLIRLMT